ncbi:rnd transporter [Lasius niger]|uniref:Rnd transporter n=1 Tax=Lasius niger TaxID=67767 RepID=A0A0J7JWQ9_LASNI|nr:rnd transporter [Lasius niger]
MLTDARVRTGIDEPSQSDQAADRLAQARQLSAQLTGNSALDRVQLAALAGVSPADLDWLQAGALPQPDTRLPPDARLGLIARRPDIAAARWRIEAARQQIDRARAAYYPDVSLLGLGGYLSVDPSLGSGVRIHGPMGTIGPSISLPLFESGRLKAQVNSAQAALDTTVAAYNAAIVKAAHEIAQQIAYLAQQRGERQQQAARIEAISRSDQRLRDQYQHGLVDARTLLNDQLQLNRLRDTELSLQGQLLNTQLQMIHALGGGYLATELPALPSAAKETAR